MTPSTTNTAARPASFQSRVQPWMLECFGAEIAGDMVERGDRFLEESLELLQSHGYERAWVSMLVDYVWGRPVGEPVQEVGGVMVTLAAYCLAAGIDMHEAGETELARILRPEIVEKIRHKQASKKGIRTPLPTLTQQQGGEQEAGELLGEPWHEEISGMVRGNPLFDEQQQWIRLEDAAAAVAAALRSKQAASEGDGRAVDEPMIARALCAPYGSAASGGGVMRVNSSLESLAAEIRGSSLPTDQLLDEWAGLIDRYAKERAELLAGSKKSIGCKYDCGGVSLTPPQIAKRTGITLQAVHQRIAAGVRGKELLAPRYAYSKKRPTKEPTK